MNTKKQTKIIFRENFTVRTGKKKNQKFSDFTIIFTPSCKRLATNLQVPKSLSKNFF